MNFRDPSGLLQSGLPQTPSSNMLSSAFENFNNAIRNFFSPNSNKSATVNKGDGAKVIGTASRDCSITNGYFAELAEREVLEGTGTYTFAHNNNHTKTPNQKTKIGQIIYGKRKDVYKPDRYPTLESIKEALTKESYNSGETITFKTYKKEKYYKRINEASIGQKVTLVATLSGCPAGQSVTFKVYEKDPMLTTAGRELVMLQNGVEKTQFTTTSKGTYATVEVELRPKKDKKTSATDTSPSLELWQEKFKHATGTPEKFDYLWLEVSAPAKNSPQKFLQGNGEALKVRGGCQITVELLNRLSGKTGNWFEGKGSNASYFKNTYNTYTAVHGINKEHFITILKQKMSEYDIDKSCYHIAHFLAQIIHESAHFDTTLEYASGTAYGTQHGSAEKMEHTVDSDGPKYRGRGLIQLTWKKNYRLYGKSKGNEMKFVDDPNAIGNNIANAIDTSCWYWRNIGALENKFNCKGDINILIDNARDDVSLVSQAVNGGRYGHANGISERKRLYKEIVKAMNLEIGEIQ